MDEDILFSGTCLWAQGLSNEHELPGKCPKEFFEERNAWRQFASILVEKSGRADNWEWIDPLQKDRQWRCFLLVHSGKLPNDKKIPVLAWMLSRMLKLVPEHMPIKRKPQQV